MVNLIIAPLFFFLGALVSWVFLAWKMDRDDSKYREMYLNMMDNRDRLSTRNYYLKKENELLVKIIENIAHPKGETAAIMLELIYHPELQQKLESIFKEASKPQEKQKCR